jgi:uncharacterized membrane protein YagU involved in acid resistance
MDRQALRSGALGGMLGGAMMAMWSMIVLWLTGVGFWTPLNLIAHTVWRGAPLDATFSWGGLVVGMVVHLMVAMLLGVVFAVVGGRYLASRMGLLGAGMVYGVVVWLLTQYVLWPLVDDAAAQAFTPWVFAVGHLLYGATTAMVVAPALAGGGARRERIA